MGIHFGISISVVSQGIFLFLGFNLVTISCIYDEWMSKNDTFKANSMSFCFVSLRMGLEVSDSLTMSWWDEVLCAESIRENEGIKTKMGENSYLIIYKNREWYLGKKWISVWRAFAWCAPFLFGTHTVTWKKLFFSELFFFINNRGKFSW